MVQEKNLGSPARGSGCDSRSPLRSNAEGTPLVIAKSESGFEARNGSKEPHGSLQASSTIVQRGECSEDYIHLAMVVPPGASSLRTPRRRTSGLDQREVRSL